MRFDSALRIGRWPASLLSRTWLGPGVAALLLFLSLGTLLGFMQRHDLHEHAQEFDSDVDSALQSVRLHLQGNEEYLTLLATDSEHNTLSTKDLLERATLLVEDNPELSAVFFADRDGVVRWVTPAGSNQEIVGLELSRPEPSRAVQRARVTRHAAYTGIFKDVMAPPALEVYVPVYDNRVYSGILGAMYSCEGLVRHAIPGHVRENNRLSLLDGSGSVVCAETAADATIDTRLSRNLEFGGPLEGVGLRVERYRGDFLDTGVWLLVLLCGALSLGMAYGMWALGTQVEERKRAQEVLQQERDNLVNVFEAMEDGVVIVTTDREIRYVNPVLVRDFGPFEGRKCFEYFHGLREGCDWCMMEDVVAGKVVHTEWCYPRNGRTYDLIDTRLNTTDGSVAKLKIFRDITERVEAEQALRESEERFHRLFERAADVLFLHDERGRIVEANQQASKSLGYAQEELQGLSVHHLATNGLGSWLRELEGRPSAEASTSLVTEYRRKDGSALPVEVRVGSFKYRGQQLLLSSARDITERRRAEALLEARLAAEQAAAEEARRRLDEIRSLQRVTTALLEKLTLEEVLDVVCHEAQALTQASGSGVLLLEHDSFRLTRCHGLPVPMTEKLPVRGSFGGLAVERDEPVVVNDLSASDLNCYREPRPASLVVVPLRVEGKAIGVLDVAGRNEGFGPEDVRILTHFADQAAIAIERARLRQQAAQGAVIEERQRLARELHDSVTQSIYSVALFADAARLALEGGKMAVANGHLNELRALAREAMLEMRLLIFELHPPSLEDDGLVGALQTRLATVETRSGLNTAFEVDGREVRLPPAVEEALYRFAQEALNNVIKHARAQQVQVRIRFQNTAVAVEVQDDGDGFDAGVLAAKVGMGLRGMHERINHAGGSVRWRTAPGEGTFVAAEIPLEAGAEKPLGQEHAHEPAADHRSCG